MTESPETAKPVREDARDWPQRPLVLALLGLATGLAVHFIIGSSSEHDIGAAQLAGLALVTIGAGLAGFTLERRFWQASLIFSAATGLVAAGVVWWNGTPDHWSGGDGWRGVALLLAIAIAAPLFQAARDEERARFPYRSVHDHAWTNIVLWGACWVFVGIAFALSFLLAELFALIKIQFPKDLLREDWFWRGLIGLAFGAALGILREQARVVHMLQRVVATVLAVLAPVLATGLILFVLALPFTGLAPLWDAGSATGILLACIVGSLILANAVIGSAPDEERRSPPLRYGARGLALVMLPLGVIAAIAIGLRIGQYGFTPERLWALTFVVIACAFGLAYLVSLRGRLDWAAKVRPANLNLAFGTCAVALLLATPLVSFNAIATHDQVARLESGKLSAEKFDWRALAFSFGEPGRVALERLKKSQNTAIRERAERASKADSRWGIAEVQPTRDELSKKLRVLPAGSAPLAPELLDLLSRYCADSGCTVIVVDPGKQVAFVHSNCFNAVPNGPCNNANVAKLVDGKWTEAGNAARTLNGDRAPAEVTAQADAFAAGKVEIRPVTRRQVFVGDKPVGEPFE